jgi:hypothetical protein
LIGALLAVFVLGVFALAVVVVLAINLNQSPPEPAPTYEPAQDFKIGGGHG